jgi:hypothetical protein
MFEPKRRGQKYHSTACRKQAWNLRLPVKRVRKDEVRYLDARRRRSQAISGYVTEHRRGKGPSAFRRYVLAVRRVQEIEQEAAMEALNKALSGRPVPCLPVTRESGTGNRESGEGAGTPWGRFFDLIRRIFRI